MSQFSPWRCWHCPGFTEIKFRGIVIGDGWIPQLVLVVLSFIGTMFLAVVVAAKFLFGWNTAWSVGAFFVALVTLLWMWASYMAR